MKKIKHPLAEVFGHLTTDFGTQAIRHRKNRLCPFNNIVPSCTKDKAKDPLGVCSVYNSDGPVITCPIRFREGWQIADDAAGFFFEDDAKWTSLTEVRLRESDGKSAGNIDIVLVAYDDNGKVCDFGSLEIQAVYISGNVRNPFAHYMSNCKTNAEMDWTNELNYPRADFLSSSRKRLAPQLMFKGGILHAWNKKMAVALDSHFFKTLPKFEEVKKPEAEMAWLVYDLDLDTKANKYSLKRTKIVYTKFAEALHTITRPKAGNIKNFVKTLQAKVDEQLESPPDNQTIESPFDD